MISAMAGTNNGCVQTRDIETLGFTLDNQIRFDNAEFLQQTLSYGFEYYTNEQVGKNTKMKDGKRDSVPNAEADNHGFYIQNEISISSTLGDFLLIPAVRFDSYIK